MHKKKDHLAITLKSDVPAFFVEARIKETDMVLSDNFIHLTDNKEHIITAKIPEGYNGQIEVSIQSLCDSYEF